jgi:hypothetical protein
MRRRAMGEAIRDKIEVTGKTADAALFGHVPSRLSSSGQKPTHVRSDCDYIPSSLDKRLGKLNVVGENECEHGSFAAFPQD